MRRALNPIEQVQVIRQHAGFEQAFTQRRQRVAAVIDAAQQHRLIQQLRAARLQGRERLPHRGVNFIGVVNVHHHDRLELRAAKPAEQLIVDALGQHHWQACMQTQTPEMRDGFQLAREFGKAAVGQRQRIAAAENHFRDRVIAGDVFQRRAPLVHAGIGIGVGEMAAETIAAMYGAGAGHRQQHPPPVFVQHARRRHGREIAHRVSAESLRRQALLGQRQYLPQQGIVRIAMTHACDEPARHPQRKKPGRGPGRRQPFGPQPHSGQQFSRFGNGAGQLCLPRRHLPKNGSSGYHSHPIFTKYI